MYSRYQQSSRGTTLFIYFVIALIVGGISFGIYKFCEPRDPSRIGTIEVSNRNQCVSSYQTCHPVSHYNSSTHSTTIRSECTTHCSAYVCQEVTERIGKHVWNDETLNVKDLYSGRCRTSGGGW